MAKQKPWWVNDSFYAQNIQNNQDSEHWKQSEKDQEKNINTATSNNTQSEGSVRDSSSLDPIRASATRTSVTDSFPNIPSMATPPIEGTKNLVDASKKYHEQLIKKQTQKQGSDIVKGFIDSIKDNGLWTDYSGENRSFRTKGADGKVKYDWGAGAMNTLGNLSKYGSMAMSFVKDKETADNTVNDAATSVRKTAQQVLLSTGNPIAMAIGAGSMLSDKVGGTASATKGLGTGNDIGNFLTSQVPFLGFAGANMGKQFQSDELAGSSMYAWNSTADGLFGGKVLFGKGRAKDLTQTNNMQRSMATNILKDAKLDFIGAQDPRYYMAAQNELNGGYDQVNSAKQGSVLQFTKRTLSKSKIKKQQDGGQVIHTTKKPEIHLTKSKMLDELVDYVEQQNPPFWKRMSGQDRNYVANEDGSVSSLKMTYSQGQEEPYVEVYPNVQYDSYGNLVDYSKDPKKAYLMARLNNDIVKMSKEDAELFTTQYKNSSKLKDYYDKYNPPSKDPEFEYNSITLNGTLPLNIPPEWLKEGGKVNVIPEGALHKNKHHLTDIDEKFEDVTTKGIPVIVESEGGEVVQQAEVERQEIIFRLEVTKKLEELSKKHTDDAAIEAGKLLVQEILYNTIDNTQEMI